MKISFCLKSNSVSLIIESFEEVDFETVAYFESLNVSYYKRGIEMLEDLRMNCISLAKGTILKNNIDFYQEVCFFVIFPAGFFELHTMIKYIYIRAFEIIDHLQ